MKIYKVYIFIFVFSLYGFLAYGLEYTGFKLMYMNVSQTNLYGVGVFTSDKRFDAEMSILVGERYIIEFFKDRSRPFKEEYGMSMTDYYKFYKGLFLALGGNFHFIRSPRMSIYIGGGLLPPIPLAARYLYYYNVGISLYQSDVLRFDLEFRRMFARNPTKDPSRIYATDNPGQRKNELVSFSFADGPSIVFSIKYAFFESR